MYLYEDAATLVEEFLFVRLSWSGISIRQVMYLALDEDDFDTIVYAYHRFFRGLPFPYAGSLFFERDVFRGVQSVHSLQLLVSLYGPPTFRTLTDAVMYYCVRGLPNLLLFLCEQFVLPRTLLELIIAELHASERTTRHLPTRFLDSSRDLAQVWLCVCNSANGGYMRFTSRRSLCRRRRRCLAILRKFRVLDYS